MLNVCYLVHMDSERIYFTEYTDGTFAACKAQDADEALDIMARSRVEMVHGPIEGMPPSTAADVDYYFAV